MADYTGNLMEDYLPNVKFQGIRTNKDITVGDSSTVTLPATTTIGGSAVVALGDITSSSTTASAFTVTNTGIFTGSKVVGITANSATTGTIVLMTANGLTSGTGMLITSTGTMVTTGNLLTLTGNSATTAAGLLRVNGNALTSGSLAAFASSSADTTARNLVSITNSGTLSVAAVPLALTNNAVTGTGSKFVKMQTLSQTSKTVTFWLSIDATTPNGNLTGTAGDICFNGPSSVPYYCTGTTNWTALA